jgi:hypothetical protein
MGERKSGGHNKPTAWYVRFVPTGYPQKEAVLASLGVQGNNLFIHVR